MLFTKFTHSNFQMDQTSSEPSGFEFDIVEVVNLYHTQGVNWINNCYTMGSSPCLNRYQNQKGSFADFEIVDFFGS